MLRVSLISTYKKGGDIVKQVIAACIDQILKFDSESSYNEYIKSLGISKQWFKVVSVDCKENGTLMVRIKKQYNNHIMEEGD